MEENSDCLQSLNDHLLKQFGSFVVPAEVREFGQFLIQNLDPNGRLPGSLTEQMLIYGKSIADVDAQAALHLIQQLEPLGCGARDAKECLLLQLRDDMPYCDVLATLISSHLEHLSQNRLPLIERKTGYSIDTIKAAIEELRYLNPFPGHAIRGSTSASGRTVPESSEEVAWDVLPIKLKEIVDKEDKKDPLSDDALVEHLAKFGYTLTRRTVMQLRKALDIPASRLRRAY